MKPSKRRHRNNLILCGTPAEKVPEPPDSNDSKKPRILKALEAVVAAGRRGLLGPAAAAAVEAMEDSELEFGNREVSQETPSSAPFVGEEEDEGRGKEKEEGKKEMEVVNKESVVSAMPPVKGTGSDQPTKKEILIFGNSVISLSLVRSKRRHGLLFPPSDASLYWQGLPNILWDDVLSKLYETYDYCPLPSIIVIHAGETDLLQDTRSSLVTRMQSDLGILKRAFPDVVIIWSSLLPRHFCKASEIPEVLESERNNVNCKMEEYCNKTGICYLPHTLITGENKLMFMPDNSLSKSALDCFILDLKEALKPYVVHNKV